MITALTDQPVCQITFQRTRVRKNSVVTLMKFSTIDIDTDEILAAGPINNDPNLWFLVIEMSSDCFFLQLFKENFTNGFSNTLTVILAFDIINFYHQRALRSEVIR